MRPKLWKGIGRTWSSYSEHPTRYSDLKDFCPIRTPLCCFVSTSSKSPIEFPKALCTNLGLFIDPLQPQKNCLSYLILSSIEHSSKRDFVGLSCKGDFAEDPFFFLLSRSLKGRSRWFSSQMWKVNSRSSASSSQSFRLSFNYAKGLVSSLVTFNSYRGFFFSWVGFSM